MASTIELPLKSTRRMTPDEVRAEASRFGIPEQADLESLRAALKAELERRWANENHDAIAGWSRWIEKHGLPLERYRVW